MAEIQLTQGKVAIVDDSDFEWLNQWKWYCTTQGYASHSIWIKGGKGKHREILMHKLILKTTKLVDHINRNQLDNRRENLRITDRKGNIANAKLFKTNKSGYRGICWITKAKRWEVKIYIKNKNVRYGRFKTLEDAIPVRNRVYKEYFGDFVNLEGRVV